MKGVVMPETDPVTGMPKETVGNKSDIEIYNRLDGQRARADQLRDDIGSQEGQAVLNKIKEHLLGRINKLMDEDGECRALKKVLIDIGVTLNMGQVAIERIMRLVEKKR
jgi:hypothetical protein